MLSRFFHVVDLDSFLGLILTVGILSATSNSAGAPRSAKSEAFGIHYLEGVAERYPPIIPQ